MNKNKDSKRNESKKTPDDPFSLVSFYFCALQVVILGLHLIRLFISFTRNVGLGAQGMLGACVPLAAVVD